MAKKDSNFEYLVLEVARAEHFVHVECFTCPTCGEEQFTAHLGAEILECRYRDCPGRVRSFSPRKPQPGEITVDHLQQAIEQLHSLYARHLELSPELMETELESLNMEGRLALARQAVAFQQLALEKVLALAEGLAKSNVSPS